MGESPATYAHADQVAMLTERVRQSYPQALAWASSQAPVLQQALRQAHAADGWRALGAIVTAHQHLSGTELAHLDRPDAAANDVITAALYLASGIDWAAVSIEVCRLSNGRWRVARSYGDSGLIVAVAMPETLLALGGAA